MKKLCSRDFLILRRCFNHLKTALPATILIKFGNLKNGNVRCIGYGNISQNASAST